MPQLKIREMPQDEGPREKLLARGVDALTNAELIAILLRTGRRGMNVVDVARELLDKYKSFAELSRCTVKELSEIKGIGQAKALELVAAFNVGKRFAQEPLSQQKLDSPESINELLGREMRMLRIESLRVVLLDTRYPYSGRSRPRSSPPGPPRLPPRCRASPRHRHYSRQWGDCGRHRRTGF